MVVDLLCVFLQMYQPILESRRNEQGEKDDVEVLPPVAGIPSLHPISILNMPGKT